MTAERIHIGPVPVAGEARREGDEPARPPLFLLADSQLLFWADEDGQFIDRIAAWTGPGAPRAAYLGASNGDNPEFYSLFAAAMEGIGPVECRMIPAEPTDEERDFTARADVILLAGGDVRRGWSAFERNGMRELVERRHREGAVLIGVSAGAVQLGTAGWPEGEPAAAFGTWGLAPFVVHAHAEASGWRELEAVVRDRGEGARGIGIPLGGGLVYHADATVEAVRHPLHEVSVRGGELSRAIILPPARADR